MGYNNFSKASKKSLNENCEQTRSPLTAIDSGLLHGFVPVNRLGMEYSGEDYVRASQAVYTVDKPIENSANDLDDSPFDISGYQIVSAVYFLTNRDPSVTISVDKIRFNAACMREFEDVEYVELLFNAVEKILAIRPSDKDDTNAIRWGSKHDGKCRALLKSIKSFGYPLFRIMGWDTESEYQIPGRLIKNGDERIMLFDLDERLISFFKNGKNRSSTQRCRKFERWR